MQKLGKRLVLDAVLSLLLLAEMFIQITGVFLHEVIGAALFIGVIAHLMLERVWIVNTFKGALRGKMAKTRMAKAVVAILLVTSMLAMGVSSVIISTVLYSAGLDLTALNSSGVWTVVHSASAYVISALVVVHLAMHWIMIVASLRVPYNPARRAAIGRAANVVAVVGVVALGVAGAQATRKNIQVLSQLEASASGSAESVQTKPEDRLEISDKPNPNDGGASASSTSEPSSPNASPGSSSSSSSSSASTGVCTLCHKRCPLSAPQCDKPYRAGLIA